MGNHKMIYITLLASVLYQVSSSCWETKNDKYPEVRILLIGKTGAGKSTTGNTILGFPAFDTKVSATSVTSHTQYDVADRFGRRLVVIDTPGLFDTGRTNMETLLEMTKWYALASPGPHAIILVVQAGRFTEEEQKTVDFFMEAFGGKLKQYLIIVFTQKDRLEKAGMTIDDFVRTVDDKSNLKSLIDETKGRYTAIGYEGQQSEREKEVRHILSMIDKMEKANGWSYYSNIIFKRVEETMRANERENLPNDVARSNSRDQVMNNDGLITKVVYTVATGIVAGVVTAATSSGGVVYTAVSIVARWLGY